MVPCGISINVDLGVPEYPVDPEFEADLQYYRDYPEQLDLDCKGDLNAQEELCVHQQPGREAFVSKGCNINIDTET